ncbi:MULTISPECIES: GyrI-like domain-containing protein [unclassified Arthrobacter]|uniref:GyrI-like domain-containing protein n=1 Tax=unclassified Arthrobacter TaxID=235627 RepID=UPI002E0015E5|nr:MULTISPECIES: GyrI-like domain-containing protein [unclassified Arthrobacter]MEC5192961.1 effector-binding domain-containing protein [Arthrobacter sp. MP_M4]MEC5204490.1 effector-binding domain-containing protein [Arthrobacter sp. MP_M7]
MTESTPETTRDIKSTQLQEQPTAVLRETVPMTKLRGFFDRAYGLVTAAAEQQHVQLAGPPFAMYRGMPTDVVDVEVGFPVATAFPSGSDGGVTAGTLPSGRAFQAMHVGPYESLPETYTAVMARMQADGATPGDAMWEYYLTDPAAEPDPAKWKTLIVWPVA